MTLEVDQGVRFTDDGSNANLVINGPLLAGPYQIFDWGNGSGSVNCTSNMLIQEYYPEWFGATGDGSTDETSAFNELIACYPAGAKIALNGLANYKINTAGGIEFTKSVHLTGSATFTTGTTVGNATTVKVSGNDSVLEMFAIVGDLRNSGGGAFDGSEDFNTNLKISLEVTGDNVTTRGVRTTNSVRGITYASTSGGTITETKLVNSSVGAGDATTQYSAGIFIKGTTGVKVFGNQITGHAISILGGSTCFGNEIFANETSDNDNNGIYISSGNYNRIFDNYVYDFDDSGIKTRGSYNTVHHNTVIALSGGSVTGIIISGSGTAVGDYNGWGSVVDANIIKGDFDAAIYVGIDTYYPTEWSITNNVIELTGATNYNYAIQVYPIGAQHCSITGNKSTGHSTGLVQQADTGKYLDYLTIANNQFQLGKRGMQLQRVRYSSITGNNCSDQDDGGNDYGMYIGECTYNHFAHNDCGEHGGGALTFGFYEASSSNYNHYYDNYTDGLVSTRYTLTGASSVVHIHGSGTGSITSGGTTDVITHGLGLTPNVEDITITLNENPSNTPGAIWVDTIGATQFTVNCENNPGASNLDFGWKFNR